MSAVNLIVIVESVRALISKEDSNKFNVTAIAAVAAALGPPSLPSSRALRPR